MKIIDLLNKIANGEEVPKRIQYGAAEYDYNETYKDYENNETGEFLFDGIAPTELNYYVGINEDEKIIPIPDDELKDDYTQINLDFNFKVLKEKINKIIEVINNEYNR